MHAADISLGILGANAIVGAAAPIAAGAAWAAKRSGADRVAVTFFGDGALNQGVLLEAMNLAALWRLPVLFVCENNGYATTMPVAVAVAGSAAGRAAGFGIPADTVDGMDVQTVRDAAERAVTALRAGAGPALLECLTYRFGPHHTIELKMKTSYRTEAEIEQWRQRDPLEIEGARIPQADRDQLDTEIAELIIKAQEFAITSPFPDPAGALDYLYASGLRARAGAL
jgi:pyruvate dehydrogenase E1 component alpha subunit